MQIRQRIYKCTGMQVLYFFSRQNSEISLLSPIKRRKLSLSKTARFLAHPVYQVGNGRDDSHITIVQII